MCVKIIKNKTQTDYDLKKPLAPQLKGSTQIIVDYTPSDPSLDVFLDEVEKICATGVNCDLKIKVIKNNYLSAAKFEKKIKKYEKDIKINNLIKAIAVGYQQTDQQLEEISSYCLGKDCNE